MMASTGRRKDPVWNYFIEIKSNGITKSTRAKCIKCNFEMSGLVERMKTHLSKCNLRERDVPNVCNSASTSNKIHIDRELKCYNNYGMQINKFNT